MNPKQSLRDRKESNLCSINSRGAPIYQRGHDEHNEASWTPGWATVVGNAGTVFLEAETWSGQGNVVQFIHAWWMVFHLGP